MPWICRSWRLALVVSLGAVLAPGPAAAQEASAPSRAVVVDPHGLPLPGVRIDVVRGGAITEILMAKDAELVAPFPDELGLHVDMSAAVLKVSGAPAEAQAFLRYVTRPEAAQIWKIGRAHV